MTVRCDDPVSQLKIVTESDQMRPSAGMLQKTVIKPFSIADPVPTLVKSDSRNNDQISFVSLMIKPGRAWFQNAECPFLQCIDMLNSAKHHLMATHRRIQHPFARLKRCGKNQSSIGFVMGRRIQCNAFSPCILIKCKQIELRGTTGCGPRIMAERTALCQHL